MEASDGLLSCDAGTSACIWLRQSGRQSTCFVSSNGHLQVEFGSRVASQSVVVIRCGTELNPVGTQTVPFGGNVVRLQGGYGVLFVRAYVRMCVYMYVCMDQCIFCFEDIEGVLAYIGLCTKPFCFWHQPGALEVTSLFSKHQIHTQTHDVDVVLQ